MEKTRFTTIVMNWIASSTYTKEELSSKLGMSRPTLDTRLVKDNWKPLEIEKILKMR